MNDKMTRLMNAALDPMLLEDTDERKALIEPDLHGFMAQKIITELQSSLDEAWLGQFDTPEDAVAALLEDMAEANRRVAAWMLYMLAAAEGVEPGLFAQRLGKPGND